MMPDKSLDWQAVSAARAGARIGRRIVYEAALPSTNLHARALARDGGADGIVVLTDDQTQGRGRLGRRWLVPPCSGITVSIVLRPPPDFALHTLAPAAALAVHDAIYGATGADCTLKWPNDVLLDGAKVAGILIELDQLDGAWMVIAGIGLNVNAAPDLPTATCLAAALGAPLAREPLLIGLLAAFESYANLAADRPDDVLSQWRERLTTLGRQVRVRTPSGDVSGVALDVDREGALLVRADDAMIHTLHAGDVTLIRT